MTYMSSEYPAESNGESIRRKLFTYGRSVAIECREKGEDDDSYMQRLDSVTSFRRTAKRESERLMQYRPLTVFEAAAYKLLEKNVLLQEG